MGRPLPLKALAFAGGMAILTALLASLAMVPALAFFSFLFLLPSPVLTAWVYLADGRAWAYGSALLAVLIAYWVGGSIIAVIAFVCALGGLALGAAAAGRAKPLLAGVMITVAMVSGMLLVLVVLKLTIGGDLLAPLRQAAMEWGQSTTAGLVISADPAKALQQQLADQVVYLFPSNLLLFFSGCALAIYVLARWTLGRRYEVAPLQPFAEWRIPRWVPWLFVPGLLLWAMGGLRPNLRSATRLGDNLMQVLNVLFEVQGLAVAFWWLRKRLGRLMAGVLVTLVGILPPISLVWVFLGIWDSLFDFRKLEPRPER